MAEARHTPGPWKFGHMMDGERWWIGQEYDRLPVAYVDRHDWPEAVVEAHLRLLAAAPDLLEALRNLVGLAKMRGGNLHEYGAAIKDAEAVLSKATSNPCRTTRNERRAFIDLGDTSSAEEESGW